jgi:hypothetical protein
MFPNRGIQSGRCNRHIKNLDDPLRQSERASGAIAVGVSVGGKNDFNSLPRWTEAHKPVPGKSGVFFALFYDTA